MFSVSKFEVPPKTCRIMGSEFVRRCSQTFPNFEVSSNSTKLIGSCLFGFPKTLWACYWPHCATDDMRLLRFFPKPWGFLGFPPGRWQPTSGRPWSRVPLSFWSKIISLSFASSRHARSLRLPPPKPLILGERGLDPF